MELSTLATTINNNGLDEELEEVETQAHHANSVHASFDKRKINFDTPAEQPESVEVPPSRFRELLRSLEKEHERLLRLAKLGHSPTTTTMHSTEAQISPMPSQEPRRSKGHSEGRHDEKKKTDDEDRKSQSQSDSSVPNLAGEGSLPRSISGTSIVSKISRTHKKVRTVKTHNHFRLLQPWLDPISTSMTSLRSSARTTSMARTTSLAAAFDATHSQHPTIVEHPTHPLVQKLVLKPTSNKRLVWDLIGMFLLVYDMLSIPFIAAFHPDEGAALVVLSYSTCIFWTFDMVLSFITGYVDIVDNIIVLEPYKIAIRYLRSWFVLDVVIVSLDWVILVSAGGTQGSVVRFGRSLRTLRFIRTFRLLRVVKLKKLLQIVQDEISSEGVSIIFGVLQVVFWLLVSNHMVGCCWYAIGSIEKEGIPDGWVIAKKMESRSLLYRYTTSLHWSLAQFTPAPNEIFPQNVYERIFATTTLVFAMVAFSSFVSSLTTAMMQLRNLMNEENRNFWILRRYLRDWKVRPAVKHRTLRYLEYAFARHQQKVQEKDVKLLGLLSQPLREELRQDTLKMHLFRHALFATCRRHVRVFNKAMSLGSYARADKFFECGEQATHMLFLADGEMEYYLGELAEYDQLDQHLRETEDEPIETSLSKSDCDASCAATDEVVPDYLIFGDWVCEPVLWTSWTHLGDLFAVTECHTVSIDGTKFVECVRIHLPLWQYMTSYAKKFLSQLNTCPAEKLTDLMHTSIKPVSLTGMTRELDAPQSFRDERRRYFSWCPWSKKNEDDPKMNSSHSLDSLNSER